jgi:hypothetical protein
MANEFIIKNGFFSQGSSNITGSLSVSAGITGSLFGTASWAQSASQALTASYYQETDPIFVAKSASLATTGSNNFNGNQTITGSLSQGLEGNIASGPGSHAEGSATTASGEYSHAEGDFTQATGNYSHAEGQNTMTLASAQYSHAEGNNTIAAANHQHVQGQWNITSSIPAAFIVGNGTDNGNRSNLIYAHDSIVEITGSLNVSGGITGSLFGTASYVSGSVFTNTNPALSASYALTASHALNGGGSSTPTFPYTGSAIISGSLIVTGSTTSTLGFTGSLFGTSSWATNALTSSYFRGPGSATISDDGSNNLSIVANRVFITGSNSVLIRGDNNISLYGGTTVYGDLIPGGPYTNNTSSYSLGSLSAAWKDLYVSNGSVYFISGSNTASISFTNGNIDFGGTNIIIPSGSIAPTASFSSTSSFLNTATTVGQNLITLSNPTAIRYLKINADNSVTTLTAAQLKNDLGFYRVVLDSGVSITASNTNLADATGLSFPITAGSRYQFKVYLIVTTTAANTGFKCGINTDVAVNSIYYYTHHNSGVTTAQFLFYSNTLDGASTNAGSFGTNRLSIIDGNLFASTTGTAIVRFGKASANAGTLTVQAGSFIEYQIF